jgi:hypothetical protein
MRDYSKVSPQFWIGKTGKALRKQGAEAVVVGMYLMTGPNSNMLGLYYLDMPTIAHQTGLGFEGACKGLQGAIDAGFCAYDHEAEVVWVYEMAAYQIAPQLKPDDKRCIGVQNEYNDLPENEHLRGFYEKYAKAFHMSFMRNSASSMQAPSKPLASQEQEQEKEQEQEQKQKQDNPIVEQKQLDPAPEIFAFWQKVMDSPKSALDAKRKTLIAGALKNYSPADICKAIRGCSKSPHNMGKNDRNTKYNGLNLILRDAEHIDYFINLDSANAKPGAETVDEMNARITAEFLGDAQTDDGNTIEMEA